MKFPVCKHAPSEDGFYAQCASCPIDSSSPGCALDEQEDGNYLFEGETPHGGVKALFFFKDNEGSKVLKKEAVHVEIHEFDDQEKLVAVLYGMVDPQGMIYLKKSGPERAHSPENLR
ncbi:MAG: hypothetical protein WCK32_04925 [Chlorobiaceae bacterium]